MGRDPRVEPRAGDVLRLGNLSWLVTSTTTLHDGEHVNYQDMDPSNWRGCGGTIAAFRDKFATATVLHVSEDSDNG